MTNYCSNEYDLILTDKKEKKEQNPTRNKRILSIDSNNKSYEKTKPDISNSNSNTACNSDLSSKVHIQDNDKSKLLKAISIYKETYHYSENKHLMPTISKIEGGLSNDLFIIQADNQSYFFKLFGGNSISFLLDRYFEEEVINRMITHGHSSEIIESDKKIYRIEKYIKDYKPIDKEDANFDLDARFLSKLFLEIGKINTCFSYEESHIKYGNSKDCMEIMKKLHDLAQAHLKELNLDFEIMEKIKETYFESQFFSFQPPLVLSHNDIHIGNIMVNPKDRYDFKIIDFEYVNLNFLGFDVVNYFVEGCIDLSFEQYPFFKVKRDFVSLYENQFYYNLFVGFITNNLSQNVNLQYFKSKQYYYKLLSIASVYWALVGIISIDMQSDIDKSSFSYKDYSLTRLQVFDLYLKYSSYSN